MLKLPTHSLDRESLYVDSSDPAWDWERVKADQDEMIKAGDPPEDHPVVVYVSGESRYDLDAARSVCGEQRTPRDYLDKPTIFTLKRLSWQEFRKLKAMHLSEDDAMAQAVRLGVSHISGDGFERTRYPLDDRTMQALCDYDLGLIDRIGAAVFNANMPLTAAELKP